MGVVDRPHMTSGGFTKSGSSRLAQSDVLLLTHARLMLSGARCRRTDMPGSDLWVHVWFRACLVACLENGVTVPSRFVVGGVTVVLVAADRLAAGAGHSLDQPLALVIDAQSGFVNFDQDLAGIPQSNLYALAAAPRVRVIPRPPASRTDEEHRMICERREQRATGSAPGLSASPRRPCTAAVVWRTARIDRPRPSSRAFHLDAPRGGLRWLALRRPWLRGIANQDRDFHT